MTRLNHVSDWHQLVSYMLHSAVEGLACETECMMGWTFDIALVCV